MEPTPLQVLKQYFGFDTFRPLQEAIIAAALSGNDVLALMPTGGGKSLCYQVPGLIKPGLCLVISPLIALMNDQVQNLRKKGITAFAIYAGMQRKEVISVFKAAMDSNCRFLYVSPERLETALFREYLPGLNVNLIVVDEAHCISQWGYDFRPPYLRIAQIRQELPGIPVMALTASATPLVQEDICQKLSVTATHDFKIFRQSFERPNISYSVFHVSSRINKITEILQNVKGSAIVYCKSRKRTRELSDLLLMQGILSDYYHAGLTHNERTVKQQNWIQDKTRVIVCTNAFGMGIDKPDVRVVIHADVTDSLENYYQEAGRAGRDGNKAFAVLLYDDQELEFLDKLPDIRYPSLDTIKTVYRSVVYYLQLPEGEPPGTYYNFDLKDFTRKFGLDINATIYGLKALEQDGWLEFNEQVFIPATVQFVTDKEKLYEFEIYNEPLEPLIKTLLRTYEGIYGYPVAVSETFIAYLLKTDIAAVKNQLEQLHKSGVIDYTPQVDTPQVRLARTRVKTALLHIDMEHYRERKLIFEDRVRHMRNYIVNTNDCRSRIIGNYFGDMAMKDCQVCDNCLNNKKQNLDKEAFGKLLTKIQNALREPMSADALLQQLEGIPKAHIWTVIDFLTAEERIYILADGSLKWKE